MTLILVTQSLVDFRPFSPMGYGMSGMMPMASPAFAMPVNSQEPVNRIDGRFPHISLQAGLVNEYSASHWEREFQSQEAALTTVEQPQQESSAHKSAHDGDELARIAGELVNTVGDAPNSKFQNSEFLGLMRQLRDGEVVVDGDKMVPREEASPDAALSSTNAKGKGRAIDPTPLHTMPSAISGQQNMHPGLLYEEASRQASAMPTSAEARGAYEESALDAYLRQDNEDYIAMNEGRHAAPAPDLSYEWWNSPQRAEDADWGRLQRDWDSFEATVTGIRPLAHYQFQPHNPYVLGEASRTRHHAMHSDARNSIFDVRRYLSSAVVDCSRYIYVTECTRARGCSTARSHGRATVV